MDRAPLYNSLLINSHSKHLWYINQLTDALLTELLNYTCYVAILLGLYRGGCGGEPRSTRLLIFKIKTVRSGYHKMSLNS